MTIIVSIVVLKEYYNSDGTYIVDETGKGIVYVSMTDECDDIELPVDRFIDYMRDIKTLRKIDNTTVITNHIRQTIIDTTRHGSDYAEMLLSKYVYLGPNYQARVVYQPFLVGLQNAKEFNCDDNYCICPCTGYLAIEIHYSDSPKLTKEKEGNLITQILFDLTRKVSVGIYVSNFMDVSALTDDAEMELTLSTTKVSDVLIDVGTLPKSYEMLELYRQAREIINPDIAFLHYYKIIEYVSTAVAKKKAIEHINQHLNQPSYIARDYQYMDTLLNIASQYKDDQRDDCLIINVIQECLDVKPELRHLPIGLLRQIKNNLGVEMNIDLESIELSPEKRHSLNKQVASIIYSTRNSIVHAKANYTPTMWECPQEELVELNEMMDSFALQMIEWNEVQSDSIRV
ncbi:MAG: hypothetical protein J6W18_08225 [Bacteroidaceae bacterium]|nr:hypothetical protein [Bacteroidaceae bacterium]